MKIIHAEDQGTHTMLWLERDDGERVAHAILVGVLEHRQGEWDLPDDIDALDVLLVQAHLAPELAELSPYDGDFQAARKTMIAEVRKHAGKVEWGKSRSSSQAALKAKNPSALDKADIRGLCELPPGIRDDAVKMARQIREHHHKHGGVDSSPAQVLAERTRREEQMLAGHQRRLEELQADDMMGAITKQRHPKYEFVDGALRRKD